MTQAERDKQLGELVREHAATMCQLQSVSISIRRTVEAIERSAKQIIARIDTRHPLEDLGGDLDKAGDLKELASEYERLCKLSKSQRQELATLGVGNLF